MKRKGYTFIELIVVIAIILVLLTSGLKIVKSLEISIAKRKLESSANDVGNILSYGKYYCRVNDISGGIKVDSIKSEILFYENIRNGKVIKKIGLNSGIKFISNLNLEITKGGHLDSNTIYIKGKNGEIKKISISVGIDTINIY